MNEERLINLETKFSYQEFLIEELRQTVREQYIKIEKLEKNLKLLMERFDGVESGLTPAGHEKPPHY
jgi:SlyX protein